VRGDVASSPADSRPADLFARVDKTCADLTAQALERIREFVRQRLDRIEALARERLERTPAADAGRESEYRKRIAELEAERARMGRELERFEDEHRVSVHELDHDRKLLAEAWERLEREQVELTASAHTQAKAGGADRLNPSNQRAPTVLNNDSAIEEAILKQFQALRRDVRQNAYTRRAENS
jgi:hypothetical protein